MSDRNTVERVKERQGLLSKIKNVFTGGYGTKEDLREMDKQLRDFYYEDLREMRHRWEKAYLGALEAGQSGMNRRFKAVIQTFDRVMEQIHRADYGYAGLFDRKGSIREKELGQVYDHDGQIAGEIERLGASVAIVNSKVDASDWQSLPKDVDAISKDLRNLELRWKEREKQFRNPLI